MSRGIDKCGPGVASRYLYQGPDGAWEPSCRAHDAAYTFRNVRRSDADRDLLHGMLINSKTQGQRALAYTYYAAVRAFGWLLFYSNHNRR
jgi:hypothetical protein